LTTGPGLKRSGGAKLICHLNLVGIAGIFEINLNFFLEFDVIQNTHALNLITFRCVGKNEKNL